MTYEQGWLIERADAKWWNGDYFTRNHLDAVRFARERDAERVIAADPRLRGEGAIATQHGWAT